MKKFELHWQILVALILAVLFGVFLKDYVHYVSWLGVIFLKALKMIIVPLIFSSIITGVLNIGNAKNLGKLGLKTISYYIITSVLATTTGLILVNIIKPGKGSNLTISNVDTSFSNRKSIGDTLLDIIPENIFEAFSSNTAMLSIIFFGLIFGFFVTISGDETKKVLSGFFDAIFEVMMKITMFIIKFAPFGVFGLVAKTVSEQESLIELAQNLGLYILVVVSALTIHTFFTLPVIMKYIGKVRPRKHLNAMKIPLLTAFSTSSSNATLPLTLEAVEKNSGVSNKISSFTLPLGATVNMDGTALYECVAVMFIAQVMGESLGFIDQILVVVTALLASIGAAGIPMAGLVTITIILNTLGLPLDGVGLILAVDRILDMYRTVVNVWGDSCGAVIIAKSEGEKLKVD